MSKLIISKRNSGYTLVEFLVAMAIFVVVFGAVANFSKDTIVYTSSLQNSLSAETDLRSLLRQFAAEIRTASIGNTGAATIVEALPTRIKFYSDYNGDGIKEQIQYYLSSDGKTLYKNVLAPRGSPLQYYPSDASTTSTIIHNITNGATNIFDYYNGTYDGTTAALSQPVDTNAVRLVKITVIIDNNPNTSPTPITGTTQVSLRNLKDNI